MLGLAQDFLLLLRQAGIAQLQLLVQRLHVLIRRVDFVVQLGVFNRNGGLPGEHVQKINLIFAERIRVALAMHVERADNFIFGNERHAGAG